MKPISAVLVLSIMLSLSVQASSQDSTDKYLGRILKCTRNIIENNRRSDEGLAFAAKVIENASIKENDLNFLKSISKSCKKYKKHNKRNKNIDRNKNAEKILALDVSDETKEILKPFNRPYYECQFRNIEAHIAVGLGVGVGLGAAKCEGTNGRRYVLLIPQASFNMGFIADVFSRGAEIDDENHLISVASGDGDLAAAYFLSEIFDTSIELDQIGTGVGLVTSLRPTGHLRFKAIAL